MESSDLNILYLFHKVLFPNCSIQIQSYNNKSSNIKVGDRILAFPVRNIIDIIFYKNRIATIAKVSEVKNIDENYTNIQLKGISRVRLKKVHKLKSGYYERIEKGRGNSKSLRILIEDIRKKSQELIFLININESDKLIYLLNFLTDISQLTDFISNYFVLKFPNRFDIYNELDSYKRALKLIPLLTDLINNLKDKEKSIEYEKKPSQ
ncbi:MAG: LON peptidase substrate-binding domain-containing protein [Spirochaetota bacterium]|nr:LON peptidase substrate-binding domain-containing protein [Spirochaetota bacterium]